MQRNKCKQVAFVTPGLCVNVYRVSCDGFVVRLLCASSPLAVSAYSFGVAHAKIAI